MTNESDVNESKNRMTAIGKSGSTGGSRGSIMLTFSADNIRERLTKEKHVLALILTATRLENIVSRAVCYHYDWSQEKFENEGYDKYSLGALMEECVEYGALPKHENELNQMRSGEREIVSLRNSLVHEYGYLDEIEKDEDLQDEVEDVIENAIDFIESVGI